MEHELYNKLVDIVNIDVAQLSSNMAHCELSESVHLDNDGWQGLKSFEREKKTEAKKKKRLNGNRERKK